MNKLYLTQTKLDSLPLYCDDNSHQEATILDYSDTEIIKLFYFISENKVYTLEEIDRQRNDLKLIQEFLLFKEYVIVNPLQTGILLDKGYAINLEDYQYESISLNDIIIVLTNIGKLLEKLDYIRKNEGKLQDFFIGDLHEGNILVEKNTKNIQICDLDSCKIGNNDPFEAKYLQFFKTYSYVIKNLAHKYPQTAQTQIFIPNHNTDLFCYITIILNLLFKIDVSHSDFDAFYRQVYALEKQGVPKPLIEIFLNIYNNVDNKNPYKLLEFIPDSFERKLYL